MFSYIATWLGKSHILKVTGLAFVDGEYSNVCTIILFDECLCFLLGLFIKEVFPVLGSPTVIMLSSWYGTELVLYIKIKLNDLYKNRTHYLFNLDFKYERILLIGAQ